ERVAAEVGVGVRVLNDERHAVDRPPFDLDLERRRPKQVAAVEARKRGPGEVVLAPARLQLRVPLDALDDAGVEADARGEDEMASVDDAGVHRTGVEVVRSP